MAEAAVVIFCGVLLCVMTCDFFLLFSLFFCVGCARCSKVWLLPRGRERVRWPQAASREFSQRFATCSSFVLLNGIRKNSQILGKRRTPFFTNLAPACGGGVFGKQVGDAGFQSLCGGFAPASPKPRRACSPGGREPAGQKAFFDDSLWSVPIAPDLGREIQISSTRGRLRLLALPCAVAETLLYYT